VKNKHIQSQANHYWLLLSS